MCLGVCLSVCLSVRLSECTRVWLSVCLSVCLSECLNVRLPLSVCPSQSGYVTWLGQCACVSMCVCDIALESVRRIDYSRLVAKMDRRNE